jgi:hypothetical protein
VEPPGQDGYNQDQFGEGYFQTLAGELGGRGLSITYLVGAQIAFVGFYNAMVLGAERTAAYFCEGEPPLPPDDSEPSVAERPGSASGGRCGRVFDHWGEGGGCAARFLFRVPAHGVRRIYCLVIASIELGLVFVDPDLLV